MITLYQAEWCPFSSAVRQRLTELGVDFVARQVEPYEEQRTDVGEIPTLVADDGTRYAGTSAIFELLAGFAGGAYEREHRERYEEHPDRHASAGKILARKAPLR